MALILPVPTPLQDNLGAVVYKLIQLNRMVNESNDNTIILDFSKTKFVFSCLLGGLFIMCQHWIKRGKSVRLGREINPSVLEYLMTVNFPSGYMPDGRDLSYYHSKSFSPLVIFPTIGNTREKCIQAVLNIVINQTNICDHNLTNTIDYFISELTNNVADHSDSECGVVIVQSYSSKKFMDITIADNGIGILASYGKTKKFNPKSEAEAMEMAMNGFSTKDIPESRGFGLSVSRNLLINGLSGMFCVWSGENIFLHGKGVKDIIQVEKGAYLKGCFLNLRLPLNVTLRGNFYDYIS